MSGDIEPIGYTYADSSVLCPGDMEARGEGDEDNETGLAGAIFSTDEAHYTITCDVCQGVILAQNVEEAEQ